MTDCHAENQLQGSPEADKPGKQAYVRPELTRFGDLKGMTQGAGSANGDGLTMTMTSDRTVKENVVQVGRHSSGIGLYLFDYKPEFRERCGQGRKLGVMADEVATIMPEAVKRHPDGYLMVDYALLASRH